MNYVPAEPGINCGQNMRYVRSAGERSASGKNKSIRGEVWVLGAAEPQRGRRGNRVVFVRPEALSPLKTLQAGGLTEGCGYGQQRDTVEIFSFEVGAASPS